MSVADVARLSLRQNRRGSLGWMLGLAAITLLYTSSYRSIAGAKAAAVDSYPASLKQALNLQDFTSPAGYLNSTAFGIPLLMLTTVFVISAATHAVAGDEESGALDLLLAYPVSRRSLVLGRMMSLVVVLIGLDAVVFLVVLVLRAPTGLAIGVSDLLAATGTWVLFACCLASIALLISAAVGRRSATLGISAGVALFAYLADSFIPLIKHLGWVREISPYYWFMAGDPLKNGLQAGYCALLLATTLAATALAVGALNRRDLRV
ncbi:MAG: ABC transporter permease [Frankiaceae bacterium]